MEPQRPKIIVAGLIKENDKYLLIKEVMEDQQEYWIVPGGHVEFGETLAQAVLREVKEETSFEAQILTLLGHKEIIATTHNYHTVIFFFLLKKVSGTLKLDEKALDGRFFTREQIKSLNLVQSAQWLFANHIKE